MPRRLPTTGRKQRGLTLVELLVALGLGLLVVVIAATALLLGQQGYRSVDTTTQLRDRERFAADLLARVIIQTGYQDLGAGSVSLRSTAKLLGNDPEPDIYGWNNAIYKDPDDLVLSTSTKITNGNRPGACTVNDTSCKNGSDVLVVRYQGVNSPTDATKPDNTMINCMGLGEAGLTNGDLNDRASSIFHVTRGTNGEPSLSCSYYNFATGAWVASQPMIEGVESFQVLFGTDGVTPLTAASAAATQDTVADRWLRADQLTVAGNTAATRENWRRVRAVRVGLVLRGPVGSAEQAYADPFTPLGPKYASPDDTGSSLSVAADRRLRLQSTFTVHLRNDLTLR
ncbi:putative transmembrane protein [Rhodoferax ferrireducens T118]|uniref:Putative transmembrane protein n=1 Tax=Albidiferax ferrireducens (strain ATCC BAA-621 / DSM 15236 / T118) TaxID=338969 RepID=Q21V26_ALBFT|nr:PilW family protein [Rhodoferax ferrireducens]ABD70377.1 putative transmembrane protein [Rhodoferax ferrireducens T118]